MSDDFQGRWHFNTCIAAIMELVNELYLAEDLVARPISGVLPIPLLAEVQRGLVVLLAPFAPHLANELWELLGERGSLLKAAWPRFDPALAKEDEIEIPVQINGKLRGRIVVPADATEDLIRERALADEKIKAALAGKQVVKTIVIPGRLVNIVVR